MRIGGLVVTTLLKSRQTLAFGGFNKRWVKLYDTLFIVLNEEGIVLSWKLCRGTKFASIDGLLKLLKRRLEAQGKKPTIFFFRQLLSLA